MPETLALYIHWPFCLAKCPYCDFNSHVRETVDVPAWQAALRDEMIHMASLTPGRRLTSLFFGGGTPSLMPASLVGALIAEADRLWGIPADTEITLEANPSSAELRKFQEFRDAGVNRLSLGVQSLRPEALRFLGRQHGVEEARQAIGWAQRIFPRFTFDLIYGRPGQTEAEWRVEFTEALAFDPRHLSLYQLTIEPGTRFSAQVARGDFVPLDPDPAAHLYARTQEWMEAAGLPAYETSNHAAPGHESRHNLSYWRYEDYAGIGPGAHGRLTIGGVRHALRQHRAPDIWLARVQKSGHATQAQDRLDPATEREERIMMGLRLREGLPLAPLGLAEDRLAPLHRDGLIALEQDRLVVTPHGRPLLDAILGHLLA
ncbi:MAG TPA: radical SAM family heme chaperone HemW [Dongiaceae bacterium]|jgi:oxygen-independent coproporphyrinogen-3 oxidase|nr:radical SAM family heme chaperone HemW [Dongiaceae bacterium]